MGLEKLEKGKVLHKAGTDTVETIEVLVKGSIKISNQYTSITLTVGGFIGIVETPNHPYKYTYEALEEAAVYSYPFESKDDIPKVIRSNPKIAPILAAQSTDTAYKCCEIYAKEYDDAIKEYDEIIADYADYPSLCLKVGEAPKDFPEIKDILPPEKSSLVPDWVDPFIHGLKEHEGNLKKTLYPLNIDIAVGMVMTTYSLYQNISNASVKLSEYRKQLKKTSASFVSTMKAIYGKLNGMENSDDSGPAVPIVNALSTILVYSGVSQETATKFEEQIAEFKANENRYDSDDACRNLRRALGNTFYDIYTPAFLKSLNDDDIPIELKMFFMFGFVDEELAGEKNTSILCNFAKAYTPDPDGKIVTIYEWLKMIYELEVEPSKNEFDQDWISYLREQKQNGNISQDEMDEMMEDPESRVKFEIHNLFALGNRMTFGRITSFVPVFDSQNVLRPLDMAYLNVAKINEYYDMIRSIDYSVFCRQAIFSDTEIGITQVYYDDDITPYMILMPNVGSRATMWQEIEGKKRSTPARMLVSIFNTENTEECMIRLFGEFRWEMCKTVQGVHWNDVTDPSLTSMYCDYLQFFKKNSALSAENKEKLRTDLKRFNNNYKNVFIADYLTYIKFESAGSPRLNRLAREILFTFCPFSKEYREKIGDNPQYAELINHYNVRINNTAKPVINAIHKLQKDEIDVPDVLTEQIEFLKK